MDLANIPKHPLAKRFKKLRVTKTQLSAHLSRPLSTVCAWLNGYNPMPSDIEQSLTELLSKLESENNVHPQE